MKNIHIIPTDKPSRLYLTTHEYIFEKGYSLSTDECQNKHIYITNSEEIKEGDWCIDIENNTIFKVKEQGHSGLLRSSTDSFVEDFCKKIILTTDQDLIKDGVQDIPDEFLEWFVKNPSCEEVGIEPLMAGFVDDEPSYYENMYEIIIPKEEPKQREMFLMNATTVIDTRKPKQKTLEEAAENYAKQFDYAEDSSPQIDFMEGAKWQQERSYSEEDMKQAFRGFASGKSFKDWFEQFKNK